jgi:hypothetical protein
MTALRLTVALLLFVSCNPAPRCKTSADCTKGAFCSAGFCADGPVSEREPAVDVDGPDAGVAEPEPVADAGNLDDGR